MIDVVRANNGLVPTEFNELLANSVYVIHFAITVKGASKYLQVLDNGDLSINKQVLSDCIKDTHGCDLEAPFISWYLDDVIKEIDFHNRKVKELRCME